MTLRGMLSGIVLAATVVPLSLVAASSSENSPAPVNALWNDAEGFGIWLYGRAGSCSQFHYQNPPFIVIGPGGAHPEAEGVKLDAAALPVCMLMSGKSQELCSGGTIQLSFVPSANEYRGRYDIRLTSGERWVGEFRAEDCKWK